MIDLRQSPEMRRGRDPGILPVVDLYREARDFPATLQGDGKLLTPARIARAGVSATTVRWHTGKGRLVRPHHGVYILGSRRPDLLDRIRAALAVCPAGTVVGFHTAAALLGFGVPEDDDIHVVVPAGSIVPHRRGLRTHESVLAVEPVRLLGMPGTPAARTAIDLARTLERGLALAVLDAALFARACTPADLATEVVRHDGLRGIRQARDLVPLADGRAECRQESELRLVLHDGGLRGFETQVEVFDPAYWSPYPAFRLDLAHRVARGGRVRRDLPYPRPPALRPAATQPALGAGLAAALLHRRESLRGPGGDRADAQEGDDHHTIMVKSLEMEIIF